jgi:hypothetical protein
VSLQYAANTGKGNDSNIIPARSMALQRNFWQSHRAGMVFYPFPKTDFMANTNPGKKESSSSRRNRKKMEDGTYSELPEMQDIPGQDNIPNAGVAGELADTTISSDDEEGVREGKDLLAGEAEDDLEIVMGTEADVTKDDLVLLGDPDADLDMGEDELVGKVVLDDTDLEGDPLNEAGVDDSASDLDVPRDEEESEAEELGEGDEENDYYSLGGDDNDDLDNGTPNEYRSE